MSRTRTISLLVFFLIAILLVALRFLVIDIRSLHSDEAVQWFFYLDKILKGEPVLFRPEYHGLASFYINALPMYVLGDSVFSIRFMTVVVSCLALLSWWFFATRIGYRGLLIALLFAAVSPSLVYYSGYFSQHAYLVFFLFLALLLAHRYSSTGKPVYLYALAPVVALLMTGHGLGLFYLGLVALLLALGWFIGGLETLKARVCQRSFAIHFVLLSALVAICAAAIASSLFTNPENLQLWLSQLGYQSDKATNTGHNKGALYYLATFAPLEIFAFIGTLLSPFLLRWNFFNLFVMAVTFSSIILLSLLPYKVPWLFVLALTQMYFLSGLALQALFERLDQEQDAAWIIYGVLVLLFLHPVFETTKLNFMQPLAHQEENPLNYVGPVADTQRIYDDLDIYLSENDARRILIVLNTHWPLPYYLQGQTVHYLEETSGKVDLKPYLRDFDVFIVHNDLYEETYGIEDLGETYEMRENHLVRVLVKRERQP